MIGLRKYAALCGVDRSAVDAALVDVPEDEQVADEQLAALRDVTVQPRDWTPLVAILGVCVVLAVGWGAFRWSRSASAAGSSAASASSAAPEPTEGDASLRALAGTVSSPLAPGVADPGALPQPSNLTAPPGEVPAAAPPSQGAASLSGQVSYGSLWSPQKAWMFLRMDDDTVIERTVAAGELVQLPSRPKYLAIGADDAELTIGITPVDVSRFVQKGTLRMGVAEFGVAEQNVLGGPAPEPSDNSAR